MTPDAGRLDRDPASTTAARPLLTAKQLAARWQVPTGHIYRLTRERKIPVVRLGRYYRYRVDAIERFETGDLAQEPAAA
jgi:excisionase family DNA binding protein